MNYAHHIIEKFGGVRATAAALGRAPSTVQGWKDRGSIPDEQKPAVLDAATRMGLKMSRDNFWPDQTSEGAT